MASNVNRPGHFLSPSSSCLTGSQEKITALLLPPSEFEKPLARDVERPTHTHQVQSKYTQGQPQNYPAVPLCAHPRKDYVDELIQRQAGEIVELRSEVMKRHLAHEQDAADWKARLSSLQEVHTAEVRQLETSLANVKEEHDIKLSRLNYELERALTEKQTETTALREKLESTKLLLERRVCELEEELRCLQEDSDSSRRQLEVELRQKTQVLEDQSVQICRLKSYICETEQTHKPALAWKMDKEAGDNKLKIAEAEKHKLTSTLELLEVRFQALKDILSIQEQELEKAKAAGVGKTKQASLLLTRWREKVFSLLVQQQTSDILHKRDIHNLQQKIHDLEDEQAASQAQVEVLQHSLTDKVAQLQIEVNKNQRLQQECEHTQQVAVCLDEQSKQDCHSVELLVEFVHRTKNHMDKMMGIMEEKSNHLKMCVQRVSFATNRMEFIKTQLVRRSALSWAVAGDTDHSLTASPADTSGSRSEVRDSEALVHQELDKLTQERDSLAAQLRVDTGYWSKMLADTKCQYTGEIKSLREELQVLEQRFQHKSQEYRDLTEEVEGLKEEVEEKDDRVKQLQAELARHERGIESVLTDQRLQDDVRWREQLTDLERKLNTAKREHAKAVVSLRQMEQSQQRRLQQSEDLLQTTEQHLTRQLEQLEVRLRTVEKERNLMMATLRQEGLLSRLKSDRGQVVHFTHEEENCSRNMLPDGGGGEGRKVSPEKVDSAATDDAQNHMASCGTVKPSFLHEPVRLVLEDLKSLSAAVFDDEDDDDEEEEEEKLEDDDVEGNNPDNAHDCNTSV